MNPKFETKAQEVVEVFLEYVDKQHSKNPFYYACAPLIRLGKKALFQWLHDNPEEVIQFLRKSKEKIDEGIKLYEQK